MSRPKTNFSVRQELSRTLNERLERRYRDEWIDSQHDLNVVVALISNGDPDLKHIKIIQTFHGALDIARFLDVLQGSNVQTVAFVGLNMDEIYSIKLAKAVSNPRSSISCLQLCRIVPTGLSKICPALSTSRSLKELRLTFNHDLSTKEIALLMKSLGRSQTLEILKLYCLQGEETTELIANAVLSAKSLTDLRITSCNLCDVTRLTNAIKAAGRFTRVDFSMNRVSDCEALATLWQCPSITFLSLSQNELGAETTTPATSEEMQRRFQYLAENRSLKRMYLDMNPLSPAFVDHLTSALEHNTTLTRLGLLTLTVPNEAAKRIRYLISLNSAGRGKMQHLPDRRLLPLILSRVSHEPQLMYGLLSQVPHAWMHRHTENNSG